MTIKYLMIYEKNGELVETPFESTIAFPSRGSGLYVRVNDHANRMLLREVVLDRIKTQDAHVRTYRQHLENLLISYDVPALKPFAKAAAVEPEPGVEAPPPRPIPTPTLPNMLAMRIAAANGRKA
jgi:hypothetical protein